MSLGSFARAVATAGAQRGQDLRQPAILLGVVEVPLPQLLGQPAMRADHAARAVLLVQRRLVVIGLAAAHQHRRDGVRVVERPHLDEQPQHRLQIGGHLGGRRRPLDQRAVRGERLAVGRGSAQAVELREDLPALGRFRIEIGSHLEGGHRGRVVLEPRPVDLPQPVPQRQQHGPLVGRHIRSHPLDLASVRPLLRLPVVRGGHQRVDAFERLQIVGIGVERALVDVATASPGAFSSSDRMFPAAT